MFLRMSCICVFIFSFGLQATEILLDLGAGYRQDTFNWNISGGKYGPKILSELDWNDLKSYDIYTQLRITLPLQIYMRFQGDYGRICEGKTKDTDYLSDHRTDIFSLSHSKANKGELFDLSLGLGYQYSCFFETLKMAFLIGLAQHEQHLRMIHGKLNFDKFNPNQEGSLSNLHNNYRARWQSLWAGIDLDFTLCKILKLFATLEYHQAIYHGTGHWNLRYDFLEDFQHMGYGNGYVLSFGSTYPICSKWNLGFIIKCQKMQLRNGQDKVFIKDAFGPFSAKTRLNQVNWCSFALITIIEYAY